MQMFLFILFKLNNLKARKKGAEYFVLLAHSLVTPSTRLETLDRGQVKDDYLQGRIQVGEVLGKIVFVNREIPPVILSAPNSSRG